MRKPMPNTSRRQFLKRGALFLPASFAVRGALSQGFTYNDLPFLVPSGGCSGVATTAVAAWVTRVVANGGASPSAATQAAMCTFYDAINTGSVLSKIKSLVMIVPDNIIAATTPFIKNNGNDPWTLNGGAGQFDLTVNGVRSTVANACLLTGCIPSSIFASNTVGGMSLYETVTNNADGGADTNMGCVDGSAATKSCTLYTNFNGAFSAFQLYSNAGGGITSLTRGTGFWCGNIIDGTTGVLYFANSGTAFADIGHIGGPGEPVAVTGSRPTIGIYAMGLNSSGSTSGTSTVRRYSFFNIHDGYTSSEAQIMYNAVQACRTKLGGGFV